MAIRQSFDFPHTCPKIDKAIEECNNGLVRLLTTKLELKWQRINEK